MEEHKKIYAERFWVSAGDTDPQQRLAVPMLVTKIIDVATIHANLLGIGNMDMPSPGCGWVLARLTIDMQSYPPNNTWFTLRTWVESWNRFYSERCFSIEDDKGKVYGYARSVWMVLDTATRRNAGLTGLAFDENLISSKPCPIERQAKHCEIEGNPSAKYRFKYCDLDAYRHVNTVRYVQLLLNQNPLDLYDCKKVGRFELSFLHEAVYGETVDIMRKDEAFFLRDSDDKHGVLYARLIMR